MKFVIFHGSFEHISDAWFLWLKKELEQKGHEVLLPQFPVDDWSKISLIGADKYKPTQSLDSWMKVFDEIFSQLQKNKHVCFIGHSLGPLFILHCLERYDLYLDYAVFVAPFFEIRGKSAIVEKANASFTRHDFNFVKLKQRIHKSTIIYCDDDPYVDEEKSLEFGNKLDSTIVKLHGMGHMGAESKMKEFPQLLELCKKVV